MISEKDIEKYLTKKIKENGGLSLKWVSPGHKGVPDRIIIIKGETYLVEVKSPNGKLTPIQNFMQAKIGLCGVKVYVLYSKKEVDIFVKEVNK